MDYTYENNAKNQGFTLICGIDEAGRGPLAGDVYAAAVILPASCTINGLNDSKKLSEKRREALFDVIREKAVDYAIATATAQEIDEINILQATFLAMRRAVDSLRIKPDFALVDGNRMPPLPCDAQTIVKGDSLSPSIAAASILAKVARDRYMTEMARKYPQYQFEKHKGYPTALHRELVLKYGPSEIHRKTFLKKLLG
ncbi:MAG: ribonuclease HII [Clostridia bacterium]|nr:ribonuclease HII [Clostridia bacterium]